MGASKVRECGVSSVGAHCWFCDLCLLDDVDSWLRSLLSLQDQGLTQGAAAEGGHPGHQVQQVQAGQQGQ